MCQFDYETIADVILHVRYTAREGGALLARGAMANLKNSIAGAQTVGSVRLFSVRHDFPTEWAKFKNTPLSAFVPLSLTLRQEHYPFWSQGILNKLTGVVFYAPPTSDSSQSDFSASSITISFLDEQTDNYVTDTTFTLDNTRKLQDGHLSNPLPVPLGTFIRYFNDNTMDDLWLAITWGA